MPAEEGAKLVPPSMLRQTAFALLPVWITLELPGENETEFTDKEPVPPIPCDHVAPPSIDRSTPLPALASRIVFTSFGSSAMSWIARFGQVPSESAVQLTPSFADE